MRYEQTLNNPPKLSGRQILDSSGQDNIFLDQDSNYFMLSISVFLFVEPHTVNSTEIWPVTMLWGLEMNSIVLQQCWVCKWFSKGLSCLSFALLSLVFRLLKTNIFIYKDRPGQPWPDEKFLTELQVWLHPGPFHNYVIAQTASNSPAEEAWHKQAEEVKNYTSTEAVNSLHLIKRWHIVACTTTISLCITPLTDQLYSVYNMYEYMMCFLH